LQDANGRNESLDKRALVAFHADLARDRSCDVNTAREVLRLPIYLLDIDLRDIGCEALYCETFCRACSTTLSVR
jgi:hypothetical protein